METTEEVSPDIVQFVKERDLARDEMKKAQDELTLTQSKLYDAMQKIEALEKVMLEDIFSDITIIEPPRGKTNNVVSKQVRHKPACTSTEKS